MSDPAPAARSRLAELASPWALIESLPVLLALVAVTWLGVDDGGFEATTWLPAALLTIGALGTLAAAAPRLLRLSRTAALAVLGLFAYAGWTYLTIGWADDRGVALAGANLTLFYASLFALLASQPRGARFASTALAALGGAIAAISLVTLWRATRDDASAAEALLYDRLSSPTGYPNATAALFAIGFWLSLALALHVGLARWARALSLGAAGISLGTCLLAQSRGWAYTAPLVLLAFVALHPRRLQGLIALAAVGLAIGAALPALLDVFAASSETQLAELEGAFLALLAVGGGLALVGAFLPLLDRLHLPRRAAQAVLALGAVLCVAAVVGVAVTSDPVARMRTAWAQFKNERNASGSGSHFGGLGSNRYDFWRVGLREFRESPLVGIGADNFAIPYIAQRRSGEQPLYPHSLWVRAFSQTGIVGFVLLLVGVAAGLWALLRLRSRADGPLAAGVAIAFLAWLAHAQGDWLWEMPALGAVAFAVLGLGASLGDPADRPLRPRPMLPATVALGAATAVALLVLGLPWLAARYEAQAVRTWRDDPSEALRLLDRAAQANRLSERPFVLAGAIASRTGDYETMASRFARAVERNPLSWYSRLELGVAHALTGDMARARAEVAVAERLNPRDSLLGEVAASIRSGQRPDPDAIDARYARQAAKITED